MASSLAERMQWILDNCRQQNGDHWDAKTLSVAAGLSTSHVGQFVRGTTKNAKIETIQAIAAQARVSAAWLATGAGTPDSLDRDEPSASTDALGHVPIAANAQGWSDVFALDQLVASSSPAGQTITPDAWERANHAARFLIHGPAAPGDALKIAKLAMEVSDPARFNTAYAANLRELAAGRAQYEADAKAFHDAVAAKARGEKPAAPEPGKKPKKGGRG